MYNVSPFASTQSIFPRVERGTFVSKQIHEIAGSLGQTPDAFWKHALNAAAFLRHQREYKVRHELYILSLSILKSELDFNGQI